MKRLDLGPRLDATRYLGLLEADGIRLAEVSGAHLDAAVPGCPGWDVADLVWHVTGVHHFWRSITGGVEDPKDVARSSRPARDELIARYTTGLTELLDTLRSTDPDRAAWSWSAEKTVAWIRRRLAQETAVHRWDAGSASDAQEPIAADLAVDGIDEFIEFFLDDEAVRKAGEISIHFHATDIDGEWFVQVRDGTLVARRAHEKGDVAVRGSASDLLLLLWGRVPEANVDVVGDRASLFSFLQLADLS